MFPKRLQTQWIIKDKPLCFLCELSKLSRKKTWSPHSTGSVFFYFLSFLYIYIFAFRIQCHMADAHVHLVGSWISTKNNPLRKKICCCFAVWNISGFCAAPSCTFHISISRYISNRNPWSLCWQYLHRNHWLPLSVPPSVPRPSK